MTADPVDHREDLPSISVRRPILAIVLNLLIVLAGIAAVMGVEVRELPSVDRPVVTVRASYPGAAPETMDAEVTRALEGAAARVNGVRSINAASEEGSTRIYLDFDPSVDVNDAANDVREAISEVQRSLPDGVEDVVVIKADDEASPILRLSVTSDSLTTEELTRLVDNEISTTLLSVPGVADVSLFGNRQRTLNIVLEPAKLAASELTIEDVADALESARLDVPAGSFESGDQDLVVRADASVVEEGAIEAIFINDNVRVRDVASVFYGPAEASSYVRLNGEQVLGLGIIRQAQSNTIEISEGVGEAVRELNQRFEDINIATISDDAVFISGAISEVLLTLLFGIIIVILVILTFLGSLRLTLIPGITIPVALIGTLAAIWLLGFSVNILTLLALVLATGLVVDDAIVVLENVERWRRHGVGRLAAAVLGTRQVFFAVLATTATLISVFVPVAFLPGRAGQLFEEFGFVLAISVGLSSFVALSLCPMLASRLIPSQTRRSIEGGRLRNGMEAMGSWIARLYQKVLAAIMKIPLLFCGAALALAASTALVYLNLDQELVPQEDRGVLVISMRGPDGVNLGYTDRQVSRAETLLEPLVESGEVRSVLSIVGRRDPNAGFIIAPLAPWSERERSQQEISDSLQPALNDIPGARSYIVNPNSLSIRTGGSDLEFAVTGPDYERIAEASEELMTAMSEELPLANAPSMEYSTTQPQLSMDIDRERAADLGIDISSIASVLRTMVDGSQVTELNVEDEAVPVYLESRFGTVQDTDDLNNLFVTTREGDVIPLSSLITIRESGIAPELERRGQRRAIEIEAGLSQDYSLNQAASDVQALGDEILPNGYSLVFLGQAEALEEAASDTMITFAIALFVVLLVLAAQFESFASAIVVMLTVPFGLAAAVLSLWLTGTSLNIYSQIGLIMIIGLMAKNGILIVEFADQLRDRGLSVREAAFQAASIRLRPVVMTMLSTILAAVPLILSGGAGSEARTSIGWVIFGGLGIAIFATLLLTPVIYQLIAPLARSRGDFGRALEKELEVVRTEQEKQA
ncbi:efflux RND transporter permease subunit [Fodinicurvata halophila]|uniref:Efflux RND transporter permease subunit n=1 Tax=Fodinicurvata halophila TaxID=1419723 RepID=A0ABV8UL62_9PROT